MDLVTLAESRTAPAPAGFDYGVLSAPLAKRTKDRAERIAGYGRQTVEIMGKIGTELAGAQNDLEHGQFLAWVAALGMSKSAAYRAIDVAKNLANELPNLGSLPVTVVQEIGSSATPEPVRKAIVAKIAAGEPVKTSEIKWEIKVARDEARKAAELARMTPEQLKAADQKAKRQRLTAKQAARKREEWDDAYDRKTLAQLDAAFSVVDFLKARLAEADLKQLAEMLDDVGARYFPDVLRKRHDLFVHGYGWEAKEPESTRETICARIEDRARRLRGEAPLSDAA